MIAKEDRLLNKLIASTGWLTRAYNKWQIRDTKKMVEAMKASNKSIDEAIEILKES